MLFSYRFADSSTLNPWRNKDEVDWGRWTKWYQTDNPYKLQKEVASALDQGIGVDIRKHVFE